MKPCVFTPLAGSTTRSYPTTSQNSSTALPHSARMHRASRLASGLPTRPKMLSNVPRWTAASMHLRRPLSWFRSQRAYSTRLCSKFVQTDRFASPLTLLEQILLTANPGCRRSGSRDVLIGMHRSAVLRMYIFLYLWLLSVPRVDSSQCLSARIDIWSRDGASVLHRVHHRHPSAHCSCCHGVVEPLSWS